MLSLLPFDEDASGWGHRAATTCFAIPAASAGVGFFSSFGSPGFPPEPVGLSSANSAKSVGNQGWIETDNFFGCLFQS
jgi:ABC-type Fe3+ transport system permease subunit